jgi:hypothetical protein
MYSQKYIGIHWEYLETREVSGSIAFSEGIQGGILYNQPIV